MKNYSKILPILFALLITIGSFNTARAQGNHRDFAFVIFETTVTKKGVETSDQNPSERRIYVSNVVEFNETNASIYRNADKVADEYFTANVVKPMEAKGILHKYYDDGIKINNRNSYIDTRADAEDLRKQILEDLKEQNANVFTFNWTREKNANGLETSQPTLLYRGAEQPLYGGGEMKTPTAPKTNDKLKPPVKKKNG